MVKKLFFLIYKIICFVNLIFNKITNKDLLLYFQQLLRENSYKTIRIINKNIIFFVPNSLILYRVNTFFTKEPETLDFIDQFKSKKRIIFWDIGGNIGLYSIYAAIKHKNIEVIAFEPSTSNLHVLSRNISINNLDKKIKICQFPLTNKKKENLFLDMKENNFKEGDSMNTFGENFNFEGKKFKYKNSYTILGTSINFLLNNKILEVPDYIKIDVDGIEHLILSGASQYLKNLKIKSLSIEINENFKKQKNQVFAIMKDSNFKFFHKKKSLLISENLKTYNYVFIR